MTLYYFAHLEIAAASLCTLHITAISVIPQYFDKHIHLAFTPQGAGSALGTLIFPFITQTLLEVNIYPLLI